jgi:hypothetical protein
LKFLEKDFTSCMIWYANVSNLFSGPAMLALVL